MLSVSPDAAVYAVVLCRRPRAGEPRHAFPGRLLCAGEVTAVGQACRATVVRCAAVRRHTCSRRALRWPAELGRALRGRGPCVLCTWAEPTP
jgi:hypothetical protein